MTSEQEQQRASLERDVGVALRDIMIRRGSFVTDRDLARAAISIVVRRCAEVATAEALRAEPTEERALARYTAAWSVRTTLRALAGES